MYKINYMKILFFILTLLHPIKKEELTAIQYYKELHFKCIPITLQDSIKHVEYKDSIYIMQYDKNNLPWVIKTKSRALK